MLNESPAPGAAVKTEQKTAETAAKLEAPEHAPSKTNFLSTI